MPTARSSKLCQGPERVLLLECWPNWATIAAAMSAPAVCKPWRNALQQFAWQSTHSEVWAKEYYQRKRAEGKSHTVAARALANVWARILYAVWQTKEPYQTATFEAAKRAHAHRQPAA